VNYKAVNGWFRRGDVPRDHRPSATMIMVDRHFVLPERLSISRPLLHVPSWQEAGRFNTPAVVSLLVAVA
jgi:hypothetical protein